jgi:hypothetical protein
MVPAGKSLLQKFSNVKVHRRDFVPACFQTLRSAKTSRNLTVVTGLTTTQSKSYGLKHYNKARASILDAPPTPIQARHVPPLHGLDFTELIRKALI